MLEMLECLYALIVTGDYTKAVYIHYGWHEDDKIVAILLRIWEVIFK